MIQKFKMTTFAAVLGLFGFMLFSAAPVSADERDLIVLEQSVEQFHLKVHDMARKAEIRCNERRDKNDCFKAISDITINALARVERCCGGAEGQGGGGALSKIDEITRQISAEFKRAVSIPAF